jgi:peptidoglycan-N-acetylglucosamine deacetylase
MRFFKTPFFLPWIFSRREWGFSLEDTSVFLTFDDGPHPAITPWVLDELAKSEIKATFFCVGDNVRKHPDIYNRILKEGHRVGNHSMRHENSSKTNFKKYIASYQEANKWIDSDLYRPPYGRLSLRKQNRILKDKKIIMWSWLAYDFDVSVSTDLILQKAEKQIKKGDILVLHDNPKIKERIKVILPQLIKIIKKKDLSFSLIK